MGLRVTVYILVTVYSPFVLQQENLVHFVLIATILLVCPLDREIFCCYMTMRFLLPQGGQLCARASFVEMRPRYRSFIARYTIAPFTPKLKHVKKTVQLNTVWNCFLHKSGWLTQVDCKFSANYKSWTISFQSCVGPCVPVFRVCFSFRKKTSFN